MFMFWKLQQALFVVIWTIFMQIQIEEVRETDNESKNIKVDDSTQHFRGDKLYCSVQERICIHTHTLYEQNKSLGQSKKY